MSGFDPKIRLGRYTKRRNAKAKRRDCLFLCCWAYSPGFLVNRAIWAMVKRNEARGTLFEDHYPTIISNLVGNLF